MTDPTRETLTPEQVRAIGLLKCRSIGESFSYDDYVGREALLELVDAQTRRVAALEAERDDAMVAYDSLLTAWAESRERHLKAEAELATLRGEREVLAKRSSTLEDAAFHFQTCRACKDGEDSCPSGARFAAFLRGEEMS